MMQRIYKVEGWLLIGGWEVSTCACDCDEAVPCEVDAATAAAYDTVQQGSSIVVKL